MNDMKRILVIAAAMLLAATASAQSGRSIYNKYSDSEGVSSVYISPAMFRMLGRIPEMEIGDEDVNLTPLIRSLNGLYVIDSGNPSVNGDLRRDVSRFVEAGKFETLMEVKDDGEVVNIYTVGTETEITSFVMITAKGDGCTFICLDGRMPREALEKLIAEAAE